MILKCPCPFIPEWTEQKKAKLSCYWLRYLDRLSLSLLPLVEIKKISTCQEESSYISAPLNLQCRSECHREESRIWGNLSMCTTWCQSSTVLGLFNSDPGGGNPQLGGGAPWQSRLLHVMGITVAASF